jgi:integrase-like protein
MACALTPAGGAVAMVAALVTGGLALAPASSKGHGCASADLLPGAARPTDRQVGLARTLLRLPAGAALGLAAWPCFTFWCKAVPRHVTFHDLRHTSATRMLDGGADLRLVQDVLGHKAPNTTARYTHLLMRGVERAQATLQFGAVDAKAPRPGMEPTVDPEGAPEVRPSGSAKGEGRDPSDFSSDAAAFVVSGRLDLNQRPLAPQRSSRSVQGMVRGRKTSQRLAMARTGIPRFRHLSPDLADLLLLVCCWDSGRRVAC